MPRFIVIGHTPGYLSEEDDPATFDEYADAVAHLNEEVQRCTDDDDADDPRYRIEPVASGNNYAAVMIWDNEKTHDLGYCIEVLEMEDDD